MDFLADGDNAVSSAGGSSMTSTVSTPITLHSLLGNYAGAEALKSGRVSSSLVKFDFADVKVINKQFKPMVRELKYDFGELAIATFLQGYEYGKPYLLLPATVMGRGQHHTIFYNADRGPLAPADLNGKRVGVRAYTVTTGMWVRGILSGDHDVDLQSITWVTFEEPHLAEYRDPPNVERAPEGKELKQMLLDGEVDAAILGDVTEQGSLRHLFPDHAAEAQRWARAHGGVPINHMAVIRKEIAESRPDVVREVYRLLKESRAAAAIPTDADDPLRFGVSATRRSLEHAIAYSQQQGLLSRRPTVDELFADAIGILGTAAD
jgi:4,5-dihydroxyphthalate decarboxylase